jgi:hypothetical protein
MEQYDIGDGAWFYSDSRGLRKHPALLYPPVRHTLLKEAVDNPKPKKIRYQSERHSGSSSDDSDYVEVVRPKLIPDPVPPKKRIPRKKTLESCPPETK